MRQAPTMAVRLELCWTVTMANEFQEETGDRRGRNCIIRGWTMTRGCDEDVYMSSTCNTQRV